MSTFVLIPGMCHGAWCFDDLAAALRGAGHRVLALTLSGVAERAHVLPGGVNLDTHITDVLAAIAVDAPGGDDLVLRDGESCWDVVNDEERAWYTAVDDTGFGVPPMPFFDDRATSHPLATVLQKLRLTGDLDRFRRREYVHALDWPGESPLRPSYDRVREDPAWTCHELDGKHNLMRDNPHDLVRILLDVARR